MPIFRLVCLVLMLAITTSSRSSAHAADGLDGVDDLDAAMTLLSALDEITVSIDETDAPVSSVLSALRAQSPVPLVFDARALDRLGVNEETPVTVRLDRTVLSTALGAILLQLGDEFERPMLEAFAGQVHITTLEATSAMRFTRVYDVRDLVRHQSVGRAFGVQGRHVPPGVAVREQGGGDGIRDGHDGDGHDGDDADAGQGDERGGTEPDDPAAASPPKPRSPGEDFVGLLIEHVDPDAWLGWGGSRARISERDGVVVVTAPASTHRALVRTLTQLRAAWPEAATIEAHLIELPRASRESVERRRHATKAALVAALRREAGAVAVWQGGIAVRFDEVAVLESESSDDGAAVRLSVTPRLDAVTSSLSLDIEFVDERAGDRRQLTTVAVIPLREGAVVLELPGSVPGPTLRLLMLTVGRQ